MKQFLLIAVLALLAGCGDNGLRSKVVGVWRYDSTTMQVPNLAVEIRRSPSFIESMNQLDASRFEFKEDGTFSLSGMGSSGTGKWTLDDHTVTLETSQGGSKSLRTLTINDAGTKLHASASTPNGDMSIDLIRAEK